MLSQFRKLMYVLMIIFYFQSSYSYETCVLEGDFVPWPWSEQYYGRVLDQSWTMIDSKGIPSSRIQITRTNILWGLANSYYTMVESDMNGEMISWGMAYDNQENFAEGNIKFNIYQKNSDFRLTRYNMKIGYWKSPDSELSTEESLNNELSPLPTPFFNGNTKSCGMFRKPTDTIVGLILEKQERNSQDAVEVHKYYGLTEMPIYSTDEL